MARMERLHSLVIDVDNNIYRINGRDISKSGKALQMNFESGEWSLMVTEDTLYTTNDQEIRG